MTPIRRAISMLLQQPSMANSIPDEIDLSTLKIKGIELLRQLIAQAQSNSDATTATLIERHRQESHFPALEKLASHDHLFGIEQFESAFFALLEQLKALSVLQREAAAFSCSAVIFSPTAHSIHCRASLVSQFTFRRKCSFIA